MIKKLRVGVASVLAAGIVLSCSACSGQVNMGSLSPQEVMEISDISDLTTIDECIEAGLFNVTDEDDEKISIVEAAEKLEKNLDKIDRLSDISFAGVLSLDPLTEEQSKKALELSDEDIDSLKEACSYKGDEVEKLGEKLTALKMLYCLDESCREWVHANGQSVSLRYMMAAIKCAVADEFDIAPEDISSITINERPGSPNNPDAVYTISVGDKTYSVSPKQGELHNTIGYIYTMQEDDVYGTVNEFPTYRKALNYAKTTIAAGVNAKGDQLVAQNKDSYIKKYYA